MRGRSYRGDVRGRGRGDQPARGRGTESPDTSGAQRGRFSGARSAGQGGQGAFSDRGGLHSSYRGRGEVSEAASRGYSRGERGFLARGPSAPSGSGGSRALPRGFTRGEQPSGFISGRTRASRQAQVQGVRNLGRGRAGTFDRVPLIFNPSPNVPLLIDARVNGRNKAELIALLQAQRKGPQRPARLGYGTLGKAIVLRANFFALDIERDTFFEYEIKITPEPKAQKTRMKRRIVELFEESEIGKSFRDYIAHDGTQKLIAARKLPMPMRGEVTFFEKGDEAGEREESDKYEVEIKFTRELSTAPLKRYLEGHLPSLSQEGKENDIGPVISGLNLVTQRRAQLTAYRNNQDRYFFDDEEKGAIAPHLDAFMGFFSSVRPIHKQLMVNVNVCMSAFLREGNLLDAMRSFRAASMGGNAAELMRDVKISDTHCGYKRVKRIKNSTVNLTANTHRFRWDEVGRTVTLYEYFKQRYGITLRYPNEQLIDVGNSEKHVYLPPELCTIEPGQAHRGRLSTTATRDMLRLASRRPAINAHHITQQGLSKIGLVDSPLLDEFGITVSKDMAVVPGRILPPPDISYVKGNSQAIVKARDGSWNFVGSRFHRGASMGRWSVLVILDSDNPEQPKFRDATDPNLLAFLAAFERKCKSSDMQVPDRQGIHFIGPLARRDRDSRDRSQAISLVEDAFRKVKDMDIVLVLLQHRDDFIYPAIKRIASVQFGILTQCIQLGKATDQRGQDQYFSNVALKVNAKLGGVNHRLDPRAMRWLTEKKTMMVGIDVTHPGPTSVPGTPSIAAVVGSVDDDFAQFPASLRIQKSKREETDVALAAMMGERLQAYRRKSNTLPERVLVFRDGVSEGQYPRVIKQELPKIIEAFKTVDPKQPKYRPKLSIVICEKRHHARFFPTEDTNADKNGNTKPGTVVDKGVTSIADFDFYLQAHAGLQATVRPTHYVVIYDENNLSADTIQQGVHTASYNYARATKAVSLIPPAYYADVACEQARFWIHGFLNQAHGTSGSSGAKAKGKSKEEEYEVYRHAERMWGAGLHEKLRDSMFYL